MPKNIKNNGAVDYLIDSARSLIAIVPDDNADLPDGPARGIWLNEATPATVDVINAVGEQTDGLLLLPGPNMFIVARVLESSVAADMCAIY